MKAIAVTLGLVLCLALSAQGTVVITFANGDAWDGAETTDTIGPLLDPTTNISGTITIGAITGGDNLIFQDPTGGAPNGFGLGVGTGTNMAGAGADPLFNVGENFAFSWNEPTQFAGISFRANFQVEDEDADPIVAETITVSSPAWVNLSITPTDPFVEFNSTFGRFTFTADDEAVANGPNQDFDAADLGGAVFLPSNSTITFAKTGVDLPGTGLFAGAGINAMSFNVVPEVSSFLFGCAVCCVLGLSYGRRQQRSNSDLAR